jgi:hypothetical protein
MEGFEVNILKTKLVIGLNQTAFETTRKNPKMKKINFTLICCGLDLGPGILS